MSAGLQYLEILDHLTTANTFHPQPTQHITHTLSFQYPAYHPHQLNVSLMAATVESSHFSREPLDPFAIVMDIYAVRLRKRIAGRTNYEETVQFCIVWLASHCVFPEIVLCLVVG